jgi:hypothetical protein
MGQAHDSMEAAEQYDEARHWLAFLIDHPDKTVSVDEYAAQIRTARTAGRNEARRQVRRRDAAANSG